jgi:hypothetical protein
MLDTDTGELIEKTLKHDGKQMREFYSALLQEKVLVGIDALVSEADGRAGNRMPRRSSSQNPQGRDPQAEARSAGYAFDTESAGGKPFFHYLDAFERATGSAHFAVAPSSMGAHAEWRAKHAAIDSACAWFATRPFLMEPRRPARTASVAVGSPCEPTKDRFADSVSTLSGID